MKPFCIELNRINGFSSSTLFDKEQKNKPTHKV